MYRPICMYRVTSRENVGLPELFCVGGVRMPYAYLDEQKKNLVHKRPHTRTHARMHVSYMLALATVLLRVASDVASCLSVSSFLS